jgi:hypothetical protein
MAAKFVITDVAEDSPSEASPHPDALEGRISASVKLAIESRHEEHEEDTFTPLIAGRPGVSASGKKDPVEDVDGEQKPTRLALYESDLKTRPRISVAIAKLVQYDPTPANPRTMKAQKKKKGAQLGTLMGVYLPCLQNILGVILFLRLTWIVGTAGWLQAFVIVSLCCLSVSDYSKQHLNNPTFSLIRPLSEAQSPYCSMLWVIWYSTYRRYAVEPLKSKIVSNLTIF